MSRTAPDIPFAPARAPVFYGWAILGLGTVGVLMSVPGQTMGVSPFTEPLMAALGLSRVTLSLAYMIGTIGSSLLLVPAGGLYDRFGARVVGTASCIALGAVLLGLSRCDVLAERLAGLVGPEYATAAAFATILVGFFALRFSGQGVLTLVSRNMIMKWFDRRRGLASGASGVFVALGFSAAPRILKDLIDAFGWQGTWATLAGVIGVGYAAVALVFWRDNPEECGLVPDGAPPPADPSGTASRPAPRDFTLGEAVRGYPFWVFALALSLFGMYVTGLTFNVASIFRQVGVAADRAYAIFLPAAAIGVTIRLLGGWASDRVPLKYLLCCMLAGIAISSAGLRVPDASGRFWTLVAGNGLCMGFFGLLLQVTWPRFFGRLHLGAISGFATALTVFASALGPYVFSQVLDATGSYRLIGWIMLAASGVLIAGSFRADNPQKVPVIAAPPPGT
ncbi:MAG: MFS transporter [Phycisphaerae bacterium]